MKFETVQETLDVLEQVLRERERQHAKWGEQKHPDGTCSQWLKEFFISASTAKAACDNATKRGECTFSDILVEEVAEALEESDPEALRNELVQVAAVAVSWVEAIDRRAKKSRGAA